MMRWVAHDALTVPRATLAEQRFLNLLPPQTEARVESILGAVRYETVWLNVGDHIYGVNEADLAAILAALASLHGEIPERPPRVGGTTAQSRSDMPMSEAEAWLDAVTDALPEGVKAIILLDIPLRDDEGNVGVQAHMVAHDFEDDDEILTSWRRHLRNFQANRVGPPS